MLRFGFTVGVGCLVGSASLALDYADHGAVCRAMTEASGVTRSDDELAACACGFDVIGQELGPEVVEVTARWEIEDKTLLELTDAFTVDQFYQMMEAVGPKIDAACGG